MTSVSMRRLGEDMAGAGAGAGVVGLRSGGLRRLGVACTAPGKPRWG